MTLEDLLAELPDEALVPVAWVRGQLGVRAAVGLTVEEAAKQFKRSPSTIRSWCRDGRLPGAYLLRNREWRIPPAAMASVDSDGRRQVSENRPHGPSLHAWRSLIANRGR